MKFFLIVFFASLTIVVFNFKFLYMAGGDLSIYVNPDLLWNDAAYSWSSNLTNLLGWSNLSMGLLMPFLLFFKIFSFLPDLAVEYAYFSLVFCAIFFSSFYFFYKYLFSKNKRVSAISSLAYVFNGFFFVYFLNYNTHLSLILLPLLFVLCHQLLENSVKKILATILLISVVVPSASINPPVVIPLFFAAFSYLVFLLVKKGSLDRKIVFRVFVAVVFFLLVNLWWIIPFMYTTFDNSIGEKLGSAKIGNIFRTTSFHDALRFLGKWSFGNYHLDFMGTDDYMYLKNSLFIFCNYSIIAAAYLAVAYKKRWNVIYFILLSLAGLFFAKGDLRPLGEWYLEFLRNFPGAYMFREPQAKFMLIYVFSISALLGYFLLYLKEEKRRIYKKVSYVILLALFIPAIPFITGGFTQKGSLGPIRAFVIAVPDYMKEYERYQKSKKLEYRILSMPRNTGTYLWDSGFNDNESALNSFTDKPVLSYANSIKDYFTPQLNAIFSSLYGNLEAGKELAVYHAGLLNVREIDQENSKDWRWVNLTKKPTEMKAVFDKYEEKNLIVQEAQFGYFSPAYLSKYDWGVSMDGKLGRLPSPMSREELARSIGEELSDAPGLVINRIKDEFFVPKFYTPEKTIISGRSPAELDRVLTQDGSDMRSVVFFKDQNDDNLKVLSDFGSGKLPVLEFRKINPTKYRVRIHSAGGVFPLVFSENFHHSWKIYLSESKISHAYRQAGNLKSQNVTKYKILEGNEGDQATKEELRDYMDKGYVTTLGDGEQKSIDGKKYSIDFISKNFQGTVQNDNLPAGRLWENWFYDPIKIGGDHLMANGYANSWIIDTDKLCRQSFAPSPCAKNPDGTYDFELVVDFRPQKMFYISLFVSLLALLACLSYLGYAFYKKKISRS